MMNAKPFVGEGYDERNMQREVRCKNLNCNSTQLISDMVSGDMVCSQCGTVAEPIIDSRSEWRNFANSDGGSGDDPSRVGRPQDILMEGLSANEISIGRQDGGSGLSKELGRTHNKNNMTASQRTTLAAFKDIKNTMMHFQYPDVYRDTAQSLFRKYAPSMRGRSTLSIVAACVFLACRMHKTPRTIKEIATITGADFKEITRCIKKLKTLAPDLKLAAPSNDTFLPRYCHELHLHVRIVAAARHVIAQCEKLGLAQGKQPATIIGAAIYFISNLSDTPKSLRDIALVVGLVESTIRSAYKDMYMRRHELVPPGFALASHVDHLPMA